jgi:hypothetical protein
MGSGHSWSDGTRRVSRPFGDSRELPFPNRGRRFSTTGPTDKAWTTSSHLTTIIHAIESLNPRSSRLSDNTQRQAQTLPDTPPPYRRRPVAAAVSPPPYRRCSVATVLSPLFCRRCPVAAVLSSLSCSRCSGAAVISPLSSRLTELILECDLCEASHLLEACPYSHIVLGARLANGPIIPESGQRKCGLCWGSGHQKRTCPCRRELQEIFQMEKHHDDKEEPELA